MRVYLARHGDAEPGNLDSERPLSEKGIKDVKRIAALISPSHLQVDYFFHSSKLRAQQTAELLSKAIHCPRGIEPRQGLSPSDLVSPIAAEINQFGHDLALVGHMPFMGKLLSKLLSGHESNDLFLFQTATLVCLEGLENGTWIIRWALCPELLY